MNRVLILRSTCSAIKHDRRVRPRPLPPHAHELSLFRAPLHRIRGQRPRVKGARRHTSYRPIDRTVPPRTRRSTERRDLPTRWYASQQIDLVARPCCSPARVRRLQLRVSTEPLQAIMRAPAFALCATAGQARLRASAFAASAASADGAQWRGKAPTRPRDGAMAHGRAARRRRKHAAHFEETTWPRVRRLRGNLRGRKRRPRGRRSVPRTRRS